MPRVSAALVRQRKTEIIDACEKLYATKGFKEITLKEISTETTFSRPSIYNYFETKEEIFLALLAREYGAWTAEIKKVIQQEEKLTAEELADRLAKTLEGRLMLLKISAMNLYEIEENSRIECLVEFKQAYKRSMDAIEDCLYHFLPQLTKERKEQIRYALFPMMYGIYPYVCPTKKQCQAMDQAGISYVRSSIYSLTYNLLRQLLVSSS